MDHKCATCSDYGGVKDGAQKPVPCLPNIHASSSSPPTPQQQGGDCGELLADRTMSSTVVRGVKYTNNNNNNNNPRHGHGFAENRSQEKQSVIIIRAKQQRTKRQEQNKMQQFSEPHPNRSSKHRSDKNNVKGHTTKTHSTLLNRPHAQKPPPMRPKRAFEETPTDGAGSGEVASIFDMDSINEYLNQQSRHQEALFVKIRVDRFNTMLADKEKAMNERYPIIGHLASRKKHSASSGSDEAEKDTNNEKRTRSAVFTPVNKFVVPQMCPRYMSRNGLKRQLELLTINPPNSRVKSSRSLSPERCTHRQRQGTP